MNFYYFALISVIAILATASASSCDAGNSEESCTGIEEVSCSWCTKGKLIY